MNVFSTPVSVLTARRDVSVRFAVTAASVSGAHAGVSRRLMHPISSEREFA